MWSLPLLILLPLIQMNEDDDSLYYGMRCQAVCLLLTKHISIRAGRASDDMKLPTHLITAVLALAISSLAIMAQEADIELRQLTDDNFRASTARGMW